MSGGAPTPAFAAPIWTAEDQAAFFRANPPRVEGMPPWATAEQLLAEALRRVTPRGCYGIVRAGGRPYPCGEPVVPGRLFCPGHAHLGWCDRACAWRPRLATPAPAAVPRHEAPPASTTVRLATTRDPRPHRQKPPPPVIPPDRSAPAERAPGPRLEPLPPRSWTRAVPWGEERYAEDICAEDWARLARVVCPRNDYSAVSLGESHARIRPRAGDWRGDHVVAHRARAVLSADDPLAQTTARV